MDEKDNRQLEDYRYTNEQIMLHQRLIVQVFTFSVIVSVALLGYGLQIFFGVRGKDEYISQYAAFIFVAPTVIIVSSAAVIYTLREAIFQLIAYSIVFHQKEEPRYETRCEKAIPRTGVLKVAFHVFIATYWILYVVCITLSSLGAAGKLRSLDPSLAAFGWFILILYIVLTTVLLGWITCFYCEIASEHKKKKRIARWERVREQEELGNDLPLCVNKLYSYFCRFVRPT